MDSAEILKRAETAMEIGRDFLSSDADDDEDDDNADEDGGNCSENSGAEGGELEDEAHDEPKQNASESIESKSEQKDPKQNDGASTSDDKTKKSENGMAKKLKFLMGVVMRPFSTKLQWKFDIIFEASNRDAKANDRNTAGRKKTNRVPTDEEKSNSTIDAGEIKRLRMENKQLVQLANKFLDEYIQLKARIGELSKVEDQLATTKSSYDSLTAELNESQDNRESLRNKLVEQSEEHRVEVIRLNEELEKMGKDLSKEEQEKKSIEDEQKQNEKVLLSMKEELEELSSVRGNLEAELIKNEEKHRSELNRLTEDLSKAQTEKSELSAQHQYTVKELERRIMVAQNLITTVDAKEKRLAEDLRKAQNEKRNLSAQNQKRVSELQQSISDSQYRRSLAETKVNRLSEKISQLEYEQRCMSSRHEAIVNGLEYQLRCAQNH